MRIDSVPCHCGPDPQSPLLPHFIQNHKMVLIPVQNAGQGHIVRQLVKREPETLSVHPDAFGRIAYSQHRHSFAGDETPLPEGLKRVTAAIVLRYHAEAGGAAVHTVKLGVEGEVHWKLKTKS